MTQILPPKRSKKGPPPPIEQTVGNLEKPEPTSLKPLNFKVPAAFHREFKSYAVQHGMSMLDLLREGFQAVKERRGF
jgi:hypothetical protein